MIPATHRVIATPRPGGLDALVLREAPVPRPRPHEVLLQVHAAGVNRADVMQRQGTYPMPPEASDVPGLEAAGVVVALGAGVTRWKLGDRVCALLFDGGYGEYACVPEVQCLPIPAGFDMVQAAALPEVVLTVWISVIEQCALLPGETVLIHGGASGVGSMAIQIAHAFGARVIATAGSAERCAACVELGAERAINYREEDFAAAARAHFPDGIDVILDMVGASYTARNIGLLRIAGRLCYVAFPEGHEILVDLKQVTMRRLRVTGVNLRHRPIPEKGRLVELVERRVWPLIARGRIKSVIGAVVDFPDAAKAHAVLEAGQVVGKVILRMRGGE